MGYCYKTINSLALQVQRPSCISLTVTLYTANTVAFKVNTVWMKFIFNIYIIYTTLSGHFLSWFGGNIEIYAHNGETLRLLKSHSRVGSSLYVKACSPVSLWPVTGAAWRGIRFIYFRFKVYLIKNINFWKKIIVVLK